MTISKETSGTLLDGLQKALNERKNPIRMMMVDVDGTLLDSSHHISPENQRAFREAQENGIVMALATGRTFAFVDQIMDADIKKEMQYNGAPGVYNCGSFILRPDGSAMESVPIDAQTRTDLLTFLHKQGLMSHVLCFLDDRAVVEQINPFTNYLHEELDDIKPQVISQNDLFVTPICKLSIIHSPEKVKQLISTLEERFKGKLTIASPLECVLECTEKATSKRRGLDALVKIYGFDPLDVIAIGNSGNDCDLFHAVGISVATANASPVAIQTAKFKTLSNDQSGVAAVWECVKASGLVPKKM